MMVALCDSTVCSSVAATSFCAVDSSVTLSCCTLDPGNTAILHRSPDPSMEEIFGRAVWIEAEVMQLTLDRCITGPIRTRNGGAVKTLGANDNIIQEIRTSEFGLLTADDVQDPIDLALILRAPSPLSTFLLGSMDAGTQQVCRRGTARVRCQARF